MKIPPHGGKNLGEKLKNRKHEENQSFCYKEQISSIRQSKQEINEEIDCATHFLEPRSMKSKEIEKRTSSAVGIIK